MQSCCIGLETLCICLFCWQVDKHRDHLINYIIFLRITPFLPNWFINITSPVINVPLGVFFIGTFLGKTVYPFCCVIFLDHLLSPTHLYSTVLIYRSGTTIFCSDQRRYNTVQTDHSWRGRVLELSGCAWCTGCALDPPRLLPEKAAEETRVERLTHPSTSSAG